MCSLGKTLLAFALLHFILQGKMEVVKQEMARVNIDILGISELNGMDWVNLTQMTIYYCGHETLRMNTE